MSNTKLSEIKITVIMPVYNCVRYVQEAVDSILEQTFTDFEFLIIDDASTDGTLAILKQYTDPRIKLIEKPQNSGYTNSLNYGLSIAKGKYIARMDGDDVSTPDRLQIQYTYMELHEKIVVCGTAIQILGTDNIYIGPENYEDIKISLLKENCLAHPSVMIRLSVLKERLISYDVTAEPAEDYRLWVRLCKYGELYNYPKVMLHYRLHNSQVSQQRSLQQSKSAIISRIEMLKLVYGDMTENEMNLLVKIFNNLKVLTFEEIKAFLLLQNKIIDKNKTNFFKSDELREYLETLKTERLKKYFLARNYYNPLIFRRYFSIKKQTKFHLNFLEEIKLIIKCVLFFKPTT